jgi:hypothetical protein
MSERDLPAWAEGDLQNPAFMIGKLRQLTEALQTLMGTRNQSGTGLSPGWYTTALSGGGTTTGTGGGSGVSTDLTPPPQPTGLVVTGGLSSIGVVWDAPTYTQGGGNAYTIIYGAKWVPTAAAPNPKPTFANATQLGSVPGRTSVMFIATEPDTYWCIWAVFVTTAGVSGQPGGGTNGAQAQTGQDPSVLLDLLSGQITESQLYGNLQSRINLIDGPSSLTGSVAQRIFAESQARAASVSQEATARQNGDTAEASARQTLATTVGQNSSAIQTNAQATSNLAGHVAASYSVRAQVTAGGRTAVGGFGLTGTVGASGPTISFGVVANQFWVGAPQGTPGVSADILPFVIQTTPTTLNGATIPAGVYMDAAYITNLTALIARFGTAWIDNAMIANLSAGKITTGAIQTGEYIQSTGYVPGSAGFRINGNGAAEFSGVTIRGTIYASAGTIGGNTITSTGIDSPGYNGASTGFRLDASTGKITVIGDGIDIRSANSGARMETKAGSLKVFLSTGAEIVRISA